MLISIHTSHTLTKTLSIAIPHSCISVTYSLSRLHIFLFYFSFYSFSGSVCVRVSVLIARHKSFQSTNLYWDTEKQQVEAIVCGLLAAAGPLFWPAWNQCYCMCVFVCICSFLTEAGEISLVWSGPLFLSTRAQDKTERPKRNLYFGTAPVGACVYVRTCQIKNKTNCNATLVVINLTVTDTGNYNKFWVLQL